MPVRMPSEAARRGIALPWEPQVTGDPLGKGSRYDTKKEGGPKLPPPEHVVHEGHVLSVLQSEGNYSAVPLPVKMPSTRRQSSSRRLRRLRRGGRHKRLRSTLHQRHRRSLERAW